MSTSVLLLVPVLALPIVLLLSFAGCALLVQLDEHVVAASFTKGPTCRIEEARVTCSGELSGVGGEAEVAFQLEALGESTFVCAGATKETTPQRPTLPSHGSNSVSKKPAAGKVEFEVSAEMTATEADLKCKSNEKAKLTKATITSLKLTVSQGGRVLFRCEAAGQWVAGTSVPLICPP